MNKIVGQCVELSAEHESLAREFMSKVIEIYAGRHIFEMRNLHFRPIPEDDGRWDYWCADHHMRLCENEHKSVGNWIARPYVEPEDQYHETHELTPHPILWVDCKLTDGSKEHRAYFGCALSDSGSLLACNWTVRSRRKKRRLRKLSAEELAVTATVLFKRRESYQARILRYCEQHGITVPPMFSSRTAARYAVIDLSCSPPKLVALTFDSTSSLRSYLDRTGIDWRQDSFPPLRILDFRSGRQLHHVGGWRLRRGALFSRTR